MAMNLEAARNKTLTKMIGALKNGRLGAVDPVLRGCVYQDETGKKCIIGCALSDEFIDELAKRNMLHVGYDKLADIYPNLVEELGITKKQGEALQGWHDYMIAQGRVQGNDIQIAIEKFQKVILGKQNSIELPGPDPRFPFHVNFGE